MSAATLTDSVRTGFAAALDRLLPGSGVSAIHVALSGGLDSQVLLHLLVEQGQRLPAPLSAIHVRHHLHPDCGAWADHCASVCHRLGVPLTTIDVRVPERGSVETAARVERYRAWEQLLGTDAVLCQGHHRDDQAETVLLRLLRGTGVDGLSGIPARRRLGRGWVLRPLLDLPRSALQAVADALRLVVVEDPANSDPRHDRSIVRHTVLPVLSERWPGVGVRLAAMAASASEQRGLLDALAVLDGLDPDAPGAPLACAALRVLPAARRQNLFRAWLRKHDLLPPGRRQLIQALADLLDAGDDRQPCLDLGSAVVRRYRDRLHVVVDRRRPDQPESRPIAAAGVHLLSFGELHLQLTDPPSRGCHPEDALRVSLLDEGLRVDRIRPGDRCRPAGRPLRKLKELLRESGMPPWQRLGWPALRAADGGIVAVPGVCVADRARPGPGELAMRCRFVPYL